MTALRHMPLLAELSLRGCQQLADGCLAHLARATRLQRLDLVRTFCFFFFHALFFRAACSGGHINGNIGWG